MRFRSLAAGVGVLIVTALGLGAAQTGSHVEQQRLIGTATGGNILVVPAIRTGDQFGTALAVDDDTAVVGVPGDDVFFSTSDTLRLGWRSGAAYVFTRNGLTGRWRELQKLFPLDPVPARQFGTALAIDGDRLVIGDPESRIAASRGGAVYVFQRDPPRRGGSRSRCSPPR